MAIRPYGGGGATCDTAFMRYDPERHRRRSIRVPTWDYAQQAWYFVTLCTTGREERFGVIADGMVTLSAAGRIVEDEWWETLARRRSVRLDDYVIMPNHMHGILIINEDSDAVPSPSITGLRSPSRTLGAVIRGFKGASTARINVLQGTPGAPVWQRNYYEHIIRDDRDLDRIRTYIAANPARWHEDAEHPAHHVPRRMASPP
jgi:putative transposase